MRARKHFAPKMHAGRPQTPQSSDKVVHQRMTLQRRRDTGPELEIRRRLHSAGLRYRLQQRIANTSRSIDIAFTRTKVAVDVRGCFWHSCPEHGTLPRLNERWWDEKLAANRRRDGDTVARLEALGWITVVVWAHEDPDAAVARIRAAIGERRKSS